MKALFTVQPAVGHLHPLVPVARALEEAGHEVVFCSPASFRGEVETFGFDCFPAGLDWVTSDRSTWTHFPPMPPPPDPSFPGFVVTVFADITTRAMVPDVLAIAREWQPDVIVREVMEWSGCLVGELLASHMLRSAGMRTRASTHPRSGTSRATGCSRRSRTHVIGPS
jgi:hypothetical protein